MTQPLTKDLLDTLIRTGPIEQAQWGKDHRTTILYAETRAVDHGGRLNDAHMRTALQYPTRLAEGKELRGHTDYDCLHDAAAVGLLVDADWEEGAPVEFTDEGFAYVHAMRVEIARREVKR